MQTLLYTFLIFGSFLRKLNGCVAQYGQCDGIGYTGEKTCCAPFTCQYSNAWYSQCLSASTVTTTPVSTNTTCHTLYSQCNGQNWAHTTCCQASVCTYVNEYYSQCLPGTTSLTSTSARTTSTASTSRVTTPTATTTASPMRTSTFTPSRTTTATTRSTTSTSTVRTTTKTTRSATSTSTTRTTTSTSMTRLSTTTARSVTSSTTPKTVTTTRTSTSMSSFKTTGSGTCSSLYSQCGGIGWTGSQLCCSGSTCRYINDYYSQCLPTDSSSTTMGSARTTTITTSSNNNDGRQPGVTTRYWDCCKASCGWPGKASVTSPVRTCAQNGNTTVDPNTQSICAGGSAYMCNNQQPWSVNSSLAYGFVAANIQGQSESNWCCACYSLIFTSGPVVGKELIVQVTNTGGDLGTNHFDLQMPGGGVGIFDGCSVQFPGPYSWGQRYGGVSQRSDCDQLPSILRSGCYWRFDWFMNADNPTMRFRQVTCPSVLTTKTGCSRL